MNKTMHLDIEYQNIFFTSDTHFGHANIIKYCDRPFKDVYEMNRVLVDNWNSKVDKNDIVFVLGDFAMAASSTINHIFYGLTGKKYLILGNHDKQWKQRWESVVQMQNLLIKDPEIKDGQRISLCHYPMLSWYQSHRGSWQLFGHVHGESTFKYFGDDGFTVKGKITPNQLDVGVDVHNFAPLSYDEVKTIITKQNLK